MSNPGIRAHWDEADERALRRKRLLQAQKRAEKARVYGGDLTAQELKDFHAALKQDFLRRNPPAPRPGTAHGTTQTEAASSWAVESSGLTNPSVVPCSVSLRESLEVFADAVALPSQRSEAA